jgi:hypothetical protein
MKRDHLTYHLGIAFLLALALYVAGFWFIESRRVAESPWVVGFQTAADGQIVIDVRQASLELGPVEICIDTTNKIGAVARQEMVFNTPKPVPFAVPGGRCVFQDATFLPGTIALEISGVAIQFLPRAFTIGTNEYAWTTNRCVLVPLGSSPRIVK